MGTRQLLKMAVWFLGFGLVAGLGIAIGQQAPPTENKGYKSTSLASINLGPEIEGMQGRQLRLRMVTLEPGGVVALHSHKDRPIVVHVLQGTFTTHPVGGPTKDNHQGESWSEGKEVTHWAENKGTRPMVLIVGEIIKQ